MSLRPTELAQVVQELSLGLVGAGVQKVWAPSPQQLTLQLRQPGRSTLLLLSTLSGAARLSVLEAREEEPPSISLQRFFRQELEGKELTSIRRLSARTVALTFTGNAAQGGAIRELRADLGSGARIRLEREQDDGAFSSDPDPAPSRLQSTGEGPFPLARAAEGLFQSSDDTARHAQLLRKARSPLETQRKRLDRTLKKVTAEAEREVQAEEHRRLGELLRHHAAQVPRGATRVVLQEYTAQGVTEVEVTLDPAMGLREQTERHFHQYRRLLRGSAKARERLVALSQERARLDAALAQLETLSPEALQAQTPVQPQRPGGAPDPERKPYREYRAWNGAPVWVGRGGVDNDALTFKTARPEHWWLHARGVPGAHVVVPLQGPLKADAELPTELLLDAAHLAHHHSDHKGEPQGEVSYTRVKFVRKVKKGAPGQVTYTREKTFWLRVEPERLARLLRE